MSVVTEGKGEEKNKTTESNQDVPCVNDTGVSEEKGEEKQEEVKTQDEEESMDGKCITVCSCFYLFFPFPQSNFPVIFYIVFSCCPLVLLTVHIIGPYISSKSFVRSKSSLD